MVRAPGILLVTEPAMIDPPAKVTAPAMVPVPWRLLPLTFIPRDGYVYKLINIAVTGDNKRVYRKGHTFFMVSISPGLRHLTDGNSSSSSGIVLKRATDRVAIAAQQGAASSVVFGAPRLVR